MSKKNTGAEDDQDFAQTAVVDQPLIEPATPAKQPSENDPVMRAESYVFGNYKAGTERKLSMDIGHLFAKGFDPTPYAFRWVRYNELESAAGRYLVKVAPTLHNKWFKPNAFHNVHKAVVRGEANLNGEKPEFYLHVRPVEAERAETQQMLDRSYERRNPEQSDVQATINGIGAAIGSEYVRGGLTHGTMSGWS